MKPSNTLNISNLATHDFPPSRSSEPLEASTSLVSTLHDLLICRKSPFIHYAPLRTFKHLIIVFPSAVDAAHAKLFADAFFQSLSRNEIQTNFGAHTWLGKQPSLDVPQHGAMSPILLPPTPPMEKSDDEWDWSVCALELERDNSKQHLKQAGWEERPRDAQKSEQSISNLTGKLVRRATLHESTCRCDERQESKALEGITRRFTAPAVIVPSIVVEWEEDM